MSFSSFWEKYKIKKEVKKETKKTIDAEEKAEALIDANNTLSDLASRRKDAEHKLSTEEEYKKQLDERRLADEISEARSRLFVQRSELLGRVMHFNREYRYISGKPDSPKKRDELERCSAAAKNAAYALAVVENAIERLDTIHTEAKWRELIRDITKAYKMVNGIKIGADLLTRLAFLWQKGKYDIKDDLTIDAMEHYYGRSIDKLLEEQRVDKVASELLVKDEALALDNEQDIIDAIQWGTIFTVQPDELYAAAEQQSERARSTNHDPIYEETTYDNPEDLETALDSLPSLM